MSGNLLDMDEVWETEAFSDDPEAAQAALAGLRWAMAAGKSDELPPAGFEYTYADGTPTTESTPTGIRTTVWGVMMMAVPLANAIQGSQEKGENADPGYVAALEMLRAVWARFEAPEPGVLAFAPAVELNQR